MGRFVSYLRVSTDRQGKSGLGLEAQRAAVAGYLAAHGGELVEEVVEIESGKRNNRPKLSAALGACRAKRAKLVIAKLDRLSRNAAFLLKLRDAKVEFIACDMPHADRFTVGILALVAEREGEMISARTKAALAAAKARGIKLGNPRAAETVTAKSRACAIAAVKRNSAHRARSLIATVTEIRFRGAHTFGKIAAELNISGVPTPRGHSWTEANLASYLKRHEVGE